MCNPATGDAIVTFDFTNIGGSNAYNLVLTETIPYGLTYVDGSRIETCPSGACADVAFSQPTPDTLRWEFNDARGIAPGEKYTVSFVVDSGDTCHFVDGSVMNLSLAYSTPCGAAGQPATNGLIVRTHKPYISITKTSSPDPLYLQWGDTATWTIALENTGDYAAAGIKLWDDFPSDLIDESTITISGGLTGLGTDRDHPWIVPDMAPGDTRTYTITAKIDGCGEGTNRAHVSWGNCDCAEETADSSTTAVITAPDMRHHLRHGGCHQLRRNDDDPGQERRSILARHHAGKPNTDRVRIRARVLRPLPAVGAGHLQARSRRRAPAARSSRGMRQISGDSSAMTTPAVKPSPSPSILPPKMRSPAAPARPSAGIITSPSPTGTTRAAGEARQRSVPLPRVCVP